MPLMDWNLNWMEVLLHAMKNMEEAAARNRVQTMDFAGFRYQADKIPEIKGRMSRKNGAFFQAGAA